MKPVDQTILTHPEGNCFPACLASILELDLNLVPKFTGEGWNHRYNEWLRPLGLSLMTISLPDHLKDSDLETRRYFLPGYCILAAQSPRFDCLHAVVVCDGEIVHDPHPQREMGLGVWKQADFLLPLDARIHAKLAQLKRQIRTQNRRLKIAKPYKPTPDDNRRVYQDGTFRWKYKKYRAIGLVIPDRFKRYGVKQCENGSVYLCDLRTHQWLADAVELKEEER